MIQHAGDLGDRAAGATLDFKFTSTAAGASDVPYTLSGGAVSVYKDNSTTQSTAGVTLTADFDSVTGLNHVRITTGSDGSFYAAGSEFQIVLTAGTIDGVDHSGYVIGSFSLVNRPLQSIVNGGITEASIAAGAISATKIGADAITAAKIADGAIDAATFATGAITAAAIAADAIGASELAADAVSEIQAAVAAGAVASVTGNVGGNVAGSVGSVTGNVGGNVTGSVGSVASGGITAASIAADAIGSSELAATAIAKIADAVLRRQCDNAEASSDGDTLDLSSLYGLIQQAQESAISGAVLTVKKTDGSTTLGTKAVTVDATTGNITAIS